MGNIADDMCRGVGITFAVMLGVLLALVVWSYFFAYSSTQYQEAQLGPACPVSDVSTVYGYGAGSPQPQQRATSTPPSNFFVSPDNWQLTETGQEFQAAAELLAPQMANPRLHLLPERSRQSLDASSPRISPDFSALSPQDQKIDKEFQKHSITVQDIQAATAKAGMLRHRTLTTRGSRTLGSTMLLRQAVQPEMPHPIGVDPHNWLDSSHRLDRVEGARPVQDVAQAHCWQT
jgi:hypothetical protein